MQLVAHKSASSGTIPGWKDRRRVLEYRISTIPKHDDEMTARHVTISMPVRSQRECPNVATCYATASPISMGPVRRVASGFVSVRCGRAVTREVHIG